MKGKISVDNLLIGNKKSKQDSNLEVEVIIMVIFMINVKSEIVSDKLKVAATYIPTDVACSIIGDGRLDFQVRNGAGYDPPSSPTTKRDKYTDVYLSLFALESLRNLVLLRV